jgi:hypothetical protein
MKVTGFTFIRNAVKFDYPVVEAIRSVLPLCDDFVVAVGNSEDKTAELVADIDSKVRIINTVWDDSPEMKQGGRVYAAETDKAFREVMEDSDWAFYIQGDEVLHEKYLGIVHESMTKWKDRHEVDGLLFNYLHFYGSYDYVAISPRWYRNEIRVIRNDRSIYSYRDAQGFRKGADIKLNVKPVDAFIYHYGWVKEPDVMRNKIDSTAQFYKGAESVRNTAESLAFDYSSIDSLQLFNETHPAVMADHIRRKNWTFDHDPSFNRLSAKYKAKIFLKEYLGINTFYANYKII